MTYIPQKNFSLNDYSDQKRSQIIYSDGYTLCDINEEYVLKVNNNTISTIFDFSVPNPLPAGTNLTTLNNTAIMQSLNGTLRINSIPVIKSFIGKDLRCKFMVGLSTSDPTNKCKVGLSNLLSEVYLGYKSTGISLNYRRVIGTSTLVQIEQAAFNFNDNTKFSEIFSSSSFNPSNLNEYSIQLTSSGSIYLELYIKNYGWIILHREDINDNSSTWMATNFNYFMETPASASGTNIRFSWVSGNFDIKRKSSYATVEKPNVNLTLDTLLLGLRCPSTINTFQNTGYIKLKNITAITTSGTSPVSIKIMKNATLSGGSYSNPFGGQYLNDAPFQVLDNSGAGNVTITNTPIVLKNFIVGGIGANNLQSNNLISMDINDISLFPNTASTNSDIVIAARAIFGNTSTVVISIEFDFIF